jgi:hypothetical protein
MRVMLWVNTSEGDDLDLFVVRPKLNFAGTEVSFSGFNGYERDDAVKGWLRASPQEMDRSRSTRLFPITIQAHDAATYPALGHHKVVNRGLHTIFT